MPKTMVTFALQAFSQIHRYRAKKRACDGCLVTSDCRTGKYGLSISRSFFQDYIDPVESYQQTVAYQKAVRKRQVWIEPRFGEIKQWHGRHDPSSRAEYQGASEGENKQNYTNITR